MNAKAVSALVAIGATALLLTGVGDSGGQTPKKDHTSAALIVTPSGCYELTLDANGVPSLTLAEHQYAQVLVLGDHVPNPTPVPPGPNPPPNPPPNPAPILSERAKLLKAAAEKATADPKRAETAQGLATVYRELAKQAKTSDPASLATAFKIGTDLVLANQKSGAAWQPFKDAMGGQWAAASLKGSAELGLLLSDAADGLDASAPQRQISPEFWAFLIELIKMLLTLLKPV